MLESGLLIAIYVFVLAGFVGFEVITKVPPTLHTPLMSGANAISGITIIGALLIVGSSEGPLTTVLGLGAVILATINVVGGFMVTDRMLRMFRSGRDRTFDSRDPRPRSHHYVRLPGIGGAVHYWPALSRLARHGA